MLNIVTQAINRRLWTGKSLPTNLRDGMRIAGLRAG
jgi:hypothetical protein